MQSIDNKILSRIYGNGKGYVFSSADFIDEFTLTSIEKSLSTLTKQNKIRRITRGMYDYPKFSELLNQELTPDIDKVAQCFARKFNWRIQISGDSALNILGLSTQIEGKYIYYSDGPNRKYKIFNTDIEFKKSKLKDIGFKYNNSALIVQALKCLGQNHIDSLIIQKIQAKIDTKMYDKILKDTKTTTSWIYEYIKQICKKEDK